MTLRLFDESIPRRAEDSRAVIDYYNQGVRVYARVPKITSTRILADGARHPFVDWRP